MDNDFLGMGWNFPVHLGKDDFIALSRGEEDIRQAIGIIIGTEKGERVMRPDFGCGLRSMVFEVMNTSTLTRIEFIVKEALLRFEPRIDVMDVTAASSEKEEGRIDIQIKYRIRSTNNVFNMVYPFYLAKGESG